MNNIKNDQEMKAKEKASLILNKVKPFATPAPKNTNKNMQQTQKAGG